MQPSDPSIPPAEGSGRQGEIRQDEADVAAVGRRAFHEVVHNWIPLAIVVVSVLAALMGWRASLAEESSAHSEELSRQDLVLQQQQLVQDNDSVDGDLQTFGQFAQYSGLAHSLLQDSGVLGGAVADELRIEGQADLGIARYLGKEIHFLGYAYDPSNPTANSNLRPDGTYSPGHPYDPALALDVAENVDQTLHGLAPTQLHDAAESTHAKAVDLTGLAALFVGVMVLLTLGAIVKGVARVWLAGSGLLIAAVGLILFALVELT